MQFRWPGGSRDHLQTRQMLPPFGFRSTHFRAVFRNREKVRRPMFTASVCPHRTLARFCVLSSTLVRLSRDKVNVLARAVSDVLKQMDEVEFIEDPNTIRQETRKILEELLNQEERIDVAARQKIESQKRTILEGSQEWDILYRKYYNEEVKKLGV